MEQGLNPIFTDLSINPIVLSGPLNEKRKILKGKIEKLISEFEEENNCWLMIDYAEEGWFDIYSFISIGVLKEPHQNVLESIRETRHMSISQWLCEIGS